MKATNNTSTDKATRVYTVNIDGARFTDVSPIELAFIRSEYGETHIEHKMLGQIWFTESARYAAIEREAYAAENAFESRCEELADTAAMVALESTDNATHEPIATRFAIAKDDKPWKMEAAALAEKYNLRKTAHKAIFTIGDDKDATRILYRRIDTDTPYVQYHGEFWAISENDIMPDNGAVVKSHTTPEKPAQKADKADKAKKHNARYTWVSFEHDGRTLARKINVADDGRELVKLDKADVEVSKLENVVHHTDKAHAEKRVNSARKAEKAARKADKAAEKTAARKAEKAEKAAAFKIPAAVGNASVDASKADASVWNPDAWARVENVCGLLEKAGMSIGRIMVDRAWAWCYPLAKIGFTDAFATAIERDGYVGYSKKASRGAYFVKAEKAARKADKAAEK